MKNYEELTIRDHFMFGKICQDPKNSQIILNSLLNTNILLSNSETEKRIREHYDSKFVRLDLLAKEDDGTLYNAELQHEAKDPNVQLQIPKRSRYYQSILDTFILPVGESYINLPDIFIIFICTYDPFGKNLPLYSFKSICAEDSTISLPDGVNKIFFNTTADTSSLPQSTQNMLKYFETGTPSDESTITIDNAVTKGRLIEEWRSEYMLSFIHDQDVYHEGYYDACLEKDAIIADKDNQLADQANQIADKDNQLADQANQIADKANQIAELKRQLEELKKA